ncbi:MAG: response regulator [Magnetococcales bacterium]|nr:response regulator [Magnetococcales bacterium]
MMSTLEAKNPVRMLRSLDRPVFGLLPSVVFFVLLVASVGTVVGFAQSQKESLTREFQEKMLAIGTLKARQIDDWVEQYYRDASLLRKNHLFSNEVVRWLRQGHKPDERSRLLTSQLNSRKSLLHYQEIKLLSDSGDVLLTTSAESEAGLDEELRPLVRQSMTDGQIRFSPIRQYASPADSIRLHMIAPLEWEGPTGNEKIAVLLFAIDLHQFLYPLLNAWPTPSRTAETLLVMQDGNDVLFLNNLRHLKNTALKFRLPLVQGSDIPGVRGVMGERGIMEGRDYRQEPVLAATIPMQRMPWVMVAKIDQEEVYAPLRLQTQFFVVVILFVLAMAAIGLRLWWVNSTQALLRKSMDRLNLSQQLAQVGSWDWDPYPDKEVWSETLYSLLGLPMGSVEPNRVAFQERIHPDDRAQVVWDLYQQLETEENFIRSYRIVRPDGQQRFMLEKGAVFRARSGKIIRVIGILLDVTERKIAEKQEKYYIQQLEKSNRAYRALGRCNAIGYYAQTESQLFRDICSIIQECCGYRLVWIGVAETEPGRRVRPVAHAGFEEGYLDHLVISWDDSEHGQGPTGQAIRTCQPVLNQDVNANPRFSPWQQQAEERGYASSAAFPLCYANHCSGVLNVYADKPFAFADEEVQLLSEIAANMAHSLHLLRLRHRQQQDEAAVRRHRTQLEGIFDASIAAILQMDLAGRILLANRSMMEMFGYTREELPTITYFDLLHASQHEVAKCGLATLDHVDAERLYVRRDGSPFWGHLMGRRMPDLPDMENSVIAIITDSTERKAAETALQQAKDEAVQANKSKNIFLASISHEIRTPLHAVINLGFLASLHTADTVIIHYLDKIQEAGKTLSRIIDDLLDLSKVEAGALVMEQVPFILQDVLNNLMTLVNTLNHKQLALRCEVDPTTPMTLQGDPQRLSQVLLNLMSNAIKFTDQGEVGLRVEVTEPGDQEVVLCFTVTDTGCGIEENQRKQIFQPFYQGEHGLAHRQGGAGLGLAICRHLVTLMGGEFKIVSQPDVGSTFSFTARFGVVDHSLCMADKANGLSVLSEDLQTSLEHLSGASVLVVEDVEINQLIITELLQRVGLRVVVTGSGQQALELLDSQNCDLVLLDLKMPDMDGFEVARRIRAIPRLEALPIIAMTAYAFSSDRQRCLEVGMNDHLAKPIDRTLLYAALRRWIPPAVRSAFSSPAPALAEPVTDPLLPTQLPGIDQNKGLGRVLGNVLLYRVLLRKFAQTYARCDDEIRQLLQEGEHEQARHRIHALGGVAGNLGAQELMTAARAVERICQPGSPLDDPLLAEHLQQFFASFSQVMTSVQPLLKSEESRTLRLDGERLDVARHQVEILEDLVQRGDIIEAMHTITLLQQQVRHTPLMQEVEHLMELLYDGNLVLAATVVRRLGAAMVAPEEPNAISPTL